MFESQAASSLVLIFLEDYESGIDIPGMTSFPNEMFLGATNYTKLFSDYGKIIAQECKSVSVKCNFTLLLIFTYLAVKWVKTVY